MFNQSGEMGWHKKLTGHTGVQVYFADPHRAWQYGSNKNAKSFIYEYFSKETEY